VRINFILPFYSTRPIGGLKVAYEYANQLAARGHEVSVIHPRLLRGIPRAGSPLRKLREAALDARNLFAPRAGLKWQPLHQNVRVMIVRDAAPNNIPDADVVFATAWQTAEYVLNYPSRKGEKFYLVMDFDPWIAAKQVLEQTWHWPLVKITISDWLCDKVKVAGVVSGVVNIPIGVNLEQFKLTNHITNRKKEILTLYSTSPSKGSEVAIAALEKCREAHPDLKVSMFGPTSRRRPAHLPAWARYYGNVTNEHLRELYNRSRIYLCSSWAEGFALPPAEAMACGSAVASTDCGGVREFAVNGVNALLSKPGDVSGLARNIIRLLDDDQLRMSLATAGHRSIQAFSWKAAADRLEHLITSQAHPSVEREVARAAGI